MFTVAYSVDRRSEEEQAYVFFRDFLDDCEGRVLKAVYGYMLNIQLSYCIAGDVSCTLEDVLIFCTGANAVPVGGFHKKIDLKFLRDDNILPVSSTCFLYLKLPTCHHTNEAFNSTMTLGFRGSAFFGFP